MTDWLPTDEAIRTRRSVRKFLPTPVTETTVRELLALATRAPSGSNIQPWMVHVAFGAVRDRLCSEILTALDRDGRDAHTREWNYYPQQWREPFIGRRRKIGWDLYSLMGIGKGDYEAAEAYRRRNYEFFDAPVGLIFTLDEDLEIGSWLDLGIYLGSLMIAARGMGLDTCPQAAFADFHKVIRSVLDIPERQIIVCGMALGYADNSAVVNKLETQRAGLDEFVVMHGT